MSKEPYTDACAAENEQKMNYYYARYKEQEVCELFTEDVQRKCNIPEMYIRKFRKECKNISYRARFNAPHCSIIGMINSVGEEPCTIKLFMYLCSEDIRVYVIRARSLSVLF